MTTLLEVAHATPLSATLHVAQTLMAETDPPRAAIAALDYLLLLTPFEYGVVDFGAREPDHAAVWRGLNGSPPFTGGVVGVGTSATMRSRPDGPRLLIVDAVDKALDLTDEARAFFRTLGASSIAWLPLSSQDELLGTIVMAARGRITLTTHDRELAESMARVLAEGVRLTKQLRATRLLNERLVLLSEAQRDMAACISRPDLLSKLAHHLVALIRPSYLRVSADGLQDPYIRYDGAESEAAWGVLTPELVRARVAVEAAGRSMHVHPTREENGDATAPRQRVDRDVLVVPLMCRGSHVGVLELSGPLGTSVDQDATFAVEAMASQYGIALDAVMLREQAARQAAEYAAVLDNLAEGLTIARVDGSIYKVNQIGARLWGVEPDAFDRCAVAEPDEGTVFSLDGNLLPTERWPMARALSGEQFADYEIVVTTSEGHQRRLIFWGGPVLGTDGNVELGVILYRDVTARREVERLKDEFVSLVSHELRGPLTAISGYAQLLVRRLDRIPGAAIALPDLHEVQVSAARMTELIDDLTDMTRLETGRLPLVYHVTDPVSAVHEALAAIGDCGTEASVVVSAASGLMPIAMDRRRVTQVLMNLIGNALKYSPHGGTVDVGVQATPSEVRYVIRDQGVGISVTELPHVFDRFFRASNTGSAEGFGLGLYIAKMLAEAHGGRIVVESAPGMGSTFTFSVPAQAAAV